MRAVVASSMDWGDGVGGGRALAGGPVLVNRLGEDWYRGVVGQDIHGWAAVSGMLLWLFHQPFNASSSLMRPNTKSTPLPGISRPSGSPLIARITPAITSSSLVQPMVKFADSR